MGLASRARARVCVWVRCLLGALLSIWPEFEWERLVLDPEPDYLRKTDRAPQANAPQTHGNAGEFHTAV
jgi:hypothetical protein